MAPVSPATTPRAGRHRKLHARGSGSLPVDAIDLHAHTVVSDGTLTPRALVRLAFERGLSALAVTDHDHVGGIAEARDEGLRLGVEIVSGIELSVEHEGLDVHLLGHLVDETSPALLARLASLRAAREARAARMVERLRALGVAIRLEDVAREAGGAGNALGRPHVARAMMRAGAVATIEEAFERYLASGRPAYVPKAKLGAAEAIALVHAAGGVATLAHPVTLPEDRREPVVRAFADAGLDGLETDHSKHGPDDARRFRAWARELGLVATGGSDFHGDNKPGVELGTGLDGNVRVTRATLDELKKRARRRS